MSLNNSKVKALKKRIRPIQVEWLRTLLSKEEAAKVTLETVEGLLPDEQYMQGIKGITLVYMSDRWLLKQLKRKPHIKTYQQLKAELDGS